MRRTKSNSALLIAIITALIFLSASLSAAELKAYGYETPAYIDLELTEMRVNEAAGTLTINLIRSGDFRQTTTVDYQTSEGEASEGQDYKGSGGTLTFSPGEGYKTIVLQILADDQSESAESFRFELTGTGPNAVVGRGSLNITIEDAPVAVSQPRLQIAPAADRSILLSWEGSDELSLERSANPAGGSWESVACVPKVEEGRCEVTQPLSGTVYFYRLRAD